MKFHKQLFRHNPPETYGDCQRTVYACLLDMHPSEVPHFHESTDDALEFWDRAHAFLASKGLARISIIFDGSLSLEQILNTQHNTNPGYYYILSGMSKNKTDHVVICKGRGIIWDPAIDNSGIIGPCSDGFWWVEYLVPKFMQAESL